MERKHTFSRIPSVQDSLFVPRVVNASVFFILSDKGNNV